MRTKLEIAEREDKLLTDMLGIIRFTEVVSAKLHRVLDEAKIYQVVREEFAKSDHYTASILLLVDDGASLQLAETSIAPSKVEVLEKASGLRAKGYKINLSKSGIYTQVVREGKTVHANVSDIIREFLPRPLAYLISKTMGYDKKSCMLTPLHKHGKVMGVLAVSCTDLCEYFTPSVENLALHISTALELAHEHAQRNRAMQALQGYQDHLGELVEERTGELKTVNEKLQEEITERKQVDEALQTEKNKLQSVIDTMEDGLSIRDKDSNIIYQSESSKRIFGDHPGEKCYRAYEGREEVCEGCPAEKAFEDGKPHTAERRVVLPSGEVTFWELRVNPIRDAGGRIVSCLEVGRNVTERKVKEKDYQNIIHTTTDGFWIVDGKGRFLDVNDAYCALTGYSREELLNMSIPDIEAVEKPEETGRRIRQIIKTGHDRFETRHRCKDGRIVNIEISTTYAGAGDGDSRLFVFARDITERKQAEEALRESNRRFSDIAENALEWIWELDAKGKYTYASPIVERILGYKPEEVVKKHFYDLFHPDDREELKKAAFGAFAKKQPFRQFANRNIHKNGETVWLLTSGVPILDEEGNLLGYRGADVDITERKQAEKALGESREKFQKMFESVTDGISVVDLNGVIIEANQRTVEMHGFTSKDELLGRNALEIVAPRDRERIAANMRKAIKGGAIRGVEYTLPKADGTEFPGELSTSVLRDASGKPVAHIIIARDITERKRMEEALRESEERFRSIVENSQVGIMILDDAYRFLYVNDEVCRISGYSREEVMGQDFRQFLDEESKQLVAERYIRRQRGEKAPPRYEFNIVNKDGQKRRVEISSSVIRDSAGAVKTVAQILDITERREADEALRESQKFSSSLLESSPSPITVVNMDTSIRYVSPAFEKLSGFTSAEIVGRKAPYPWWLEGKRERALAAFKDAIEHGGRRTERNFRKKNGEHFWVTLSTAPVMQDGKPVYMIISWLDITERKRAEEKEKQLQQELYLAQRLAAVGELAAGVAHEINNPLTGVLGFSQRLMRKSTDKEVSRDLEIIHSEARRAADVVQNLLTFARRRQPKKEYTSINDILQRTLELRSYALHTSNIEVTTAFAPRLPKAMVDFPQIQEVFLNIILNAEQAMSEAHGRGELIIKTQRQKGHVRISFADDGPGISPKNIDKVFDPFFTTREQKGGTGLGLSACHGIVTEHGGRIYVRSKPGQGATFIVELLLSPAETSVAHQS